MPRECEHATHERVLVPVQAQYERILGKALMGRGPPAEHWAHSEYAWLVFEDGDLVVRGVPSPLSAPHSWHGSCAYLVKEVLMVGVCAGDLCAISHALACTRCQQLPTWQRAPHCISSAFEFISALC